MQSDLEKEHKRFVDFGNACFEAVNILEMDNPVGAATLRRKIEAMTQRWDNLVTRMDEYSETVLHLAVHYVFIYDLNAFLFAQDFFEFLKLLFTERNFFIFAHFHFLWSGKGQV